MSPCPCTPRTAACLLTAALLLAACTAAPSSSQPAPSTASSTPSASPVPSATATSPPETLVPSPSPTAPPSTGPVIVTIRVDEQQDYRVRLTDPADIQVARELLDGDPDQLATIPSGRIVRGDPGVNTGYSWHIDPNDFEWAEISIEVCDGLPSDVSTGTVSGERYCPWHAEVVDIQPE